MNRQQRRSQTRAARKSAGPSPIATVHALIEEALRHHQAGRLIDAERLYTTVLEMEPRHADALHLLGVLAYQAGQMDIASDLIGKAIEINPLSAAYHANLGLVNHDMERLDDALAAFDTAIRIKPKYAEAHYNRGNTLNELNRTDDALAAYNNSINIEPNFAEVHHNCGVILLKQGRTHEAIAAICRSLRIKETVQAKAFFTECMKHPNFADYPEDLTEWVLRSLSEPWARPSELAGAAIRLIKKNPAIVELIEARASLAEWSENQLSLALDVLGTEPLLLCLLGVAEIPDIEFEQLLTRCRSVLLQRIFSARSPDALSEQALRFCSALAQQCFLNEYVYACSNEETDIVGKLRDSIASSLTAGTAVSAPRVIVLACYVPLHSVPDADRLMELDWPDLVKGLVTTQIAEPRKEGVIRTQVPRLTDIEDEISTLVMQQYEEHPYPRWIAASPVPSFPSIDEFFFKNYFRKPYRPQRVARPEILIAGCGTGQHPIERARMFPDARLLAVDLSLSSLAYGVRKAEELGVANIEFARADILKFEGLEPQFDLIESVGVLHHLGDPLAGMRVLMSLLRPNGVMFLGLYSQLARTAVVAVREHIAEQGYTANSDDIRRCRQELLALSDTDSRKQVVGWPDFFSMSNCRDLLFHTQEHRFSIPDIAAWLDMFGLTFIGFQIASDVKERFRRYFAGSADETDLGLWHRFETAYPMTFAGMYQFWVQKGNHGK